MRVRTKIVAGLTAALATAGGVAAVMPQASAGENCHAGDQLAYCVSVFTNHGYAAGWARISDNKGGGDYYVSVSRMSLQKNSGSGWRTVTTIGDYDGMYDYAEEAKTGHFACNASQVFRTKVLLTWRKKGSSKHYKSWQYSRTERCYNPS
ncbi:MAG: hypothetical protein ACRDT6_10720 [Micromonosporaceae bacterium]